MLVNVSHLEPLSGIEAETARNASLDVGYARGPFASALTDTFAP